MTSSITMLALYAALLFAVLLRPYVSPAFGSHADRQRRIELGACALLLLGAVALTAFRQGAFPLIGIFVLIPLFGLGTMALLGGITAALLFATTIWWTQSLSFGLLPTAIAALLTVGSGFLPRWKPETVTAQSGLLQTMLPCAMIGVGAGLLTAPFEAADTIYLAWHHWGAYLAPVEAWRGGGVPYRDFPIQYGLGPTVVLLAGCGQDCWRGMYETTVVANAFYFATLAGSVVILTAQSSRGVRWLALLAMFCASFMWTGFPSNFAGPVITPSVAGLRFLSISALLLHILYAEYHKRRRDWIGHGIWLIDLFWSPEAAFFGTLIWWPYLALRDATEAGEWRGALIALARGAARGAIALTVGICILALVLWLLSARTITLADFFAYVQHPPGALPVNLAGTIWIALATLALGILVLTQQGLSAQARPLYTCLLGFLAAGTYYISRSHDNNILNLFPLLILVLLAILGNLDKTSDPARHFGRAFSHTMLVAMVIFVVTFDYRPLWQGIARVGPLHVGPTRLVTRFAPSTDDAPAILPADAIAGLNYLRHRHAGAVLLFDRNYLMVRSSGAAWASVNNLANFVPLPAASIAHYIRQGAAAYKRPGWILADDEHRHWVDAFRVAYDVQNDRPFGNYRAYHLVPRGTGSAEVH
ncbi:hypothetical protein [Novosphingobium sp. Chol11]|uniref:hypothetical protein n=1 Tax=Novosphingobium sp. Chol11 TaxID=1385763 RepID=UPI001141F46E|nr:hypothetical protein [Novosphingobium sp. Chol11]